jgi:hypothetical protein
LAGPAIITIAIASPANNDSPSIIILILTSARADLAIDQTARDLRSIFLRLARRAHLTRSCSGTLREADPKSI